MKKIDAIVRPEKLEAVLKALNNAGCKGLMISEIEGHGTQKGIIQQWRGEKYMVKLIPKVRIEVIVKDSDMERIINVIVDCVRTGEIGDGKIFVSDISDVVRIRTNERKEAAL